MLIYMTWAFYFEDTSVDYERQKKSILQKKINIIVPQSEINLSKNKKDTPSKKPIIEKLEEAEIKTKTIKIMNTPDGSDSNRFPEIDQDLLERPWDPDPETIANPEEYIKQQNEAREAELPNIYEATRKRIINMKKIIEDAENNDSQSPDEIDEAKEAFEQLLKFQEELGKHLENDEHIPQKSEEIE